MQLHIAHKYIYNHLLRQNNDTPIPLLAQAHNFRFTKLGPTVLEAKIINVLSDEPCELWQAPSVSRNLVPQRPIFYQISQLVAIRDWYLPKFWCQPNARRMFKFEIAICIPPKPAHFLSTKVFLELNWQDMNLKRRWNLKQMTQICFQQTCEHWLSWDTFHRTQVRS